MLVSFKILLNFATKKPFQIKKAFCPICGKNGRMIIDSTNLRESNYCISCFGNSRYKAMAIVLKKLINSRIIYYQSGIINQNLNEIVAKDVNKVPLNTVVKKSNAARIVIYEPDSRGTIHNSLRKSKGYVFSEYFLNRKKGEMIKGIRNEDLQDLSFRENSIDIVITQDIFEHIKNPEKAFMEIYRILKVGGYHVFTTPLYQKSEKLIDENDQILKYPVIYHGDHMNNQGAKVYTNFGKDIIDTLKNLNYGAIIYHIEDERSGIAEVDVIISQKK
jgi:SAM-dependent methyltransferase